MSRFLIILPYRTLRYVALAHEIKRRVLSSNSTYTLLDITSASFPRLANVSKAGAISSWGSDIIFLSGQHVLELEHKYKQKLNSIVPFTSQAVSIRRGTTGILYRSLVKAETKAVSKLLGPLLETIKNGEFTAIVIPNGRFGLSKSLGELVLELPKKPDIYFFELAPSGIAGKDKFFLEAFPVHSRISVQKALKELDVSSFDSSQVFHSWLEPRMLSGSQDNAFASKWGESLSSKAFESSSSETNLFLTSSTDEFQALGQEWQEDKWVDQYEAFEAVIGKLKEKGETNFVLRIHPNLSNKSLRFVRDEISRIRWIKNMHPELVVIGPLSKTNTYSLIAEAKRVVVSLSMAGLESSGLGIPVWCTMANNYDLVADVRRLLNRESITTKNLHPWQVDVSKAHQYVTAALNFGEDYVLSGELVKDSFTRRLYGLFRMPPLYLLALAVLALEKFPVHVILKIELDHGRVD